MTTASIKAVIVLDQDGARLHSKYFSQDLADPSKQSLLEANLHAKTKLQSSSSGSQVVMLDNCISVYKSGHDVTFFVVGSVDENEMILDSVLEGLYESLNGILRSQLDKRVLLDNLELLLLTVDELVDGGMILENDPTCIANRVMMKGAEGSSPAPAAEITVAQAFASAREHFSRTFGS